jgi:hypothetical protein
MLNNTVDPRREQTLEVSTIFRPITHQIVIIDLQALLGDDEEEGATEEEISKLEKVDQVAECSICQESHEGNTKDI